MNILKVNKIAANYIIETQEQECSQETIVPKIKLKINFT